MSFSQFFFTHLSSDWFIHDMLCVFVFHNFFAMVATRTERKPEQKQAMRGDT